MSKEKKHLAAKRRTLPAPDIKSDQALHIISTAAVSQST